MTTREEFVRLVRARAHTEPDGSIQFEAVCAAHDAVMAAWDAQAAERAALRAALDVAEVAKEEGAEIVAELKAEVRRLRDDVARLAAVIATDTGRTE